MAAAIDVVAPQVSHEGRALLRHANLRLRHARLEQVIRAMRARGRQSELAAFERELDAVRDELRRLGNGGPPCPGGVDGAEPVSGDPRTGDAGA